MASGSPSEEPGLRSQADSVKLDWTAVRAHLAAHGHRLDTDPPPRQFAGGLANLNYLIHLDGKPAVLRRPPMGELPAGAYDMAREFRILSRLPDALPFVAARPVSVRRSVGDRPALPDHRIPARPGDPRAPAARTGAPAGDRRAPVAGAAGDDRRDPRGRYRRRSDWTISAGRRGSCARGVAGWRKRGLAAMEDGTEALHDDVGAWLEQHIWCRTDRRGCCTMTSS